MKRLDQCLSSLKPYQLFFWFNEITKIPRPSGKEEKIREFIVNFAKERNLEHHVDAAGNVLIRKPAVSGAEDMKGIILQGHIDMVTEKNSGVVHDFETDPIIPYVCDDGWIRTKGTTLGADNGIGVAAALAILDSKDIHHGPLEAVFTIDEETGLTGVKNIKLSLDGDILLNLDTEEDSEFTVSCAGGIDINTDFHYSSEFSSSEGKKWITNFIKISELKGGHSAIDINRGRANAIKIMFRFFRVLFENNITFSLHSVIGGTKRNAIPRECEAVILFSPKEVEKFTILIDEFINIIKNEFRVADPGILIQYEKCKTPQLFMGDTDQLKKIVNSINACPNGVYRMSDEIPGLVETSNNLAKVEIKDGNVKILCMARSSIASARDYIVSQISSVFELAGGKVKTTGEYPGWPVAKHSEILDIMTQDYFSLFVESPKVTGTHGGLECGIFLAKYPNLDAISFGPTIKDAHSPNEAVNIASCTKFWNLLVEVLEGIPVNY